LTQDSHKAKTVAGLKWNLLDKLVSQGAGFVINIILARLLLPEDFGLLGMVTVIIGFATVFKNFGLGSALIQKKNLTSEDLTSVFWFNMLVGIALTFIIYFSAPLIAAYYELPAVEPIAKLLSVTYFIGSLNIVQLSLLRKRMDFRKIFIVNASATLVSGITAIVLALNGWGVWSLVWKMIIFSIATNLVLWLGSKWRPGLNWSKDSLKEIMGFSLPLLGTQSLNYWVRNADNLLIGKYLGGSALGFYNQSYRIMLIPVRQITGVVSSVLFPSLAQIQDDKERIKAIYLKVTRLLSFITFPLMFGLCALAEPFVQIVLGENWMPMVPVLRYLSIVGAFQSIGTLNGNVFQATGRTAYQFWVGLPAKLFILAAIAVGISGGIEQVAMNYMIATLISSAYMYYFMGQLINLKLSEIYRNLLLNFILAFLMSVVVFFSYKWTLPITVNIVAFVVSIFIGALAYMVLSYVFNRKILKETMALKEIKGK
jgi:PST family polysaccharide transporter